MVSKVATDFAKLEVEDQSPVLRWNWISSVFPMDIICKLDEETEFYDPVMQDNCKLIFTLSGNKMVFISKYSTQTWISSSTITDNFMIIVSFQEHLFSAVLLRNYYQVREYYPHITSSLKGRGLSNEDIKVQKMSQVIFKYWKY